MKKNYNVIWFDDEYQTLDIIIEKAMLADINLVGFSNAEDGLKELKNNINWYDAVIVDGIFYQSNNEQNAQVTSNAMGKVAMELKQLEDKRIIPWYILSGQPSFTKEKNQIVDLFSNNKVYDKLSDEDLDELWNKLKLDADSQLETQIRHRYADVFELCSEKYIGESNYEKLLRLLFAVEGNDYKNPIYYNEIRKLLESIFTACNIKGLFPQDCTEMNARSLYLGRKEMQAYVPFYIQRNIHSVVQISQDGSHLLSTDGDVSKGNAPYLLRSTIFELFNILLWYKNFAIEYPNGILIAENEIVGSSEALTSDSVHITGKIEQDNKGNFHCNEFLLNYNYTLTNFKLGDTIQINEFEDNGNPKSNFHYPKYAIKFIKI
jgi:hypothetical protein